MDFHIPKLALINDLTGYGRCSLAVALPVVSIMGVQACPAPTSVFSNHMGFPSWSFHDLTEEMPRFLEEWNRQGLAFDGICCGFLGTDAQIEIVGSFLPAHPEAAVILDPVLGDHGKLYSSVTPLHCEKMKELTALARVITPNITEACLLADVPFKEYGWTYEELCVLADRLHELGPSQIAITGIRRPGAFINFISRTDTKAASPSDMPKPLTKIRSLCETPVKGHSRPGTGDIFAAVISAGILRGLALEDCVKKAASFIGVCTEGSDRAGIPIEEGVLFEKYLYLLHETES